MQDPLTVMSVIRISNTKKLSDATWLFTQKRHLIVVINVTKAFLGKVY